MTIGAIANALINEDMQVQVTFEYHGDNPWFVGGQVILPLIYVYCRKGRDRETTLHSANNDAPHEAARATKLNPMHSTAILLRGLQYRAL